MGEAGRAVGTTVEVRDLFFNTPARLKFQRSPKTEANRIVAEVTRQALVRQGIGFRLTIDRRTLVDVAPAEKLEDRVRDILGAKTFGAMLPVTWGEGVIEVAGWISTIDSLVRSRRNQYIFVNRRCITSRVLLHAIYAAYDASLRDRHPQFVLLVEMPPTEVDVNVHPAKREVRFHDDRRCHTSIEAAVRSALGSGVPSPARGSRGRGLSQRRTRRDWGRRGADGSAVEWLELTGGRQGSEPPGAPEAAPGTTVASPGETPLSGETRSDVPATGARPAEGDEKSVLGVVEEHEGRSVRDSPADRPGARLDEFAPQIALWQLDNTYIFAQVKDGCVIIDQHAAHERILYEQIMEHGGGMASQQLLFPFTLELTALETQVLENSLPGLSQIGFAVRPFGGRTFVVEAVPAMSHGFVNGEMISDILAELGRHGRAALHDLEEIAAIFACKAAIKAGQPLKLEEMNSLVDKLFATRSPYCCPHGRPTMIRLPLAELARRFERGGG
jgi:DNA mismatch repair protein MutL